MKLEQQKEIKRIAEEEERVKIKAMLSQNYSCEQKSQICHQQRYNSFLSGRVLSLNLSSTAGSLIH